MFEFYWPDVVDNFPFVVASMMRMAAAILVSVVVIFVVDYFQWPKWLAIQSTK